MKLAFRRFFKYSTVGLSTFCLDLFLLYVLTENFSVDYVYAAGTAFLIAVTINYFLGRKYVFNRTLRNVGTGYATFLLIALIGMIVVMGGMYILVTVLQLNYLLSRILIAGVTGFWNYLMNLYVNFRVVGKH